MSNEFIVKNGLIVGGNVVTSGTITINGALAATQSWVTSQAYLTSASLSGYATQSYVTSAISSLIDAAPAALDTLNELAAALGDDANFSTTITTAIGNKVSKSGDTMTGNLSFGATSNLGLTWGLNTDAAFIKFVSTGNQAGGSYLEIGTQDDLDEEIKFTQSGSLRFYLATDGFLKNASGYKYVFENGTWGINITGNANYATTAGALTSMNISQFTNNSGYLTSYTETDTLNSVTGRGASTANLITVGGATISNNLITTNGIADPAYARITNPGGGISVGSSPISAAIKIALPANGSFTNIMLSFTVHIYDYALGRTRTLKIAGYTYFNQDWYNVSVYQSGGELIENINVRFGVEGGRNCVWIGETNTYWSYPNIFVTDVQCGHSQTANLTSGWTISLVTSFGTVQSTLVAYTNITTKDIGGTTNYVSKFTGAKTLGNSLIFDNGTNVGIGTNSPSSLLNIVASGSGSTALTVQDNARKIKIGRDQIEVTDLSDVVSTMYLQPNSNLVINGTAGNVGIGSQPSYKLDVNGTIRTQTGYILGANGLADITIDGNIGSQLRYGNQKILLNSADAYIYTNNIARVYVNNAGNVGIGTTSPGAARLNVVSDNNSNNPIIEAYALNLSQGMGLAYSGLKAIGSNADVDIVITPKGTGNSYFSAGNVGIGTSSPANKLTIQSNSTQLRLETASDPSAYHTLIESNYNSSNPLNIYSSAAASNAMGTIVLSGITGVNTYLNSYYGIVFGTSTSSITTGTVRMMITNGGNVGIGTTNPQSKLHIETSSSNPFRMVRGSTNFGFEIGGGAIGLYDYEDSIYRWYVDSIGNIGIGTTSPSQKLQVNGSAEINSSLYVGADIVLTRADTTPALLFTTQNGLRWTYSGGGNYWTASLSIDSANLINMNGSPLATRGWVNSQGFLTSVSDIWVNTAGDTMTGTLSFAQPVGLSFANGQYIKDNNSGGLIIYSGAAVGITGTSIAVTGAATFSDRIQITSNGGTNPVLAIRQTNAGSQGYDFETEDVSVGRLDLYGVTSSGRVQMMTWIKASGRVGIGTTAPTNKLHVISPDNEGIYMQGSSNGGHWFNFASANSNLWSMGAQPSLMGWYNRSDSSYKMVITDGGNVGIGTVSPTEKFHVLGRAIFDGGSGDSSTDAVLYVTKSNNNDWGLYVNAAALDYGMYARVSPSANYAIAVNNGTSWTTRITGDGRIYLNEKDTIASYDGWLRLNSSAHYTSGVYTPYALRNDGAFDNYGGIYGYNTIRARKLQTVNNYTTAALWTESYDLTTTGIAFHISGIAGKFLEMRTNGVLYWENSQVWTAGTDGSGSGLDADLLDGQNSTEFLRLLSGGAEANLDSYTDNGFRSVSFPGYSQHLLSWNAGGSAGTVQQLFHYNTPNNGWRIRNKTDNSSWSDWGYVVMASSNQGLISGTIATQSWVGSQSYATTSYVTTQINNLIAGAPGALDTLDELAAALGDDSNFATTVTNSIAAKLPLAGGTMTGDINWTQTDRGLTWGMNTDGAYIKFYNTGDGDVNSRLEYATSDNGDEYHRWLIAGTEKMTLKWAGLTINGTITESSSIKLKENVETSEGNLEKVVNLRPVTYNKIGSQTTELGLIAEEVATVYPEFVQYDENGDPIGVNYSRLTAALIGAVKELTNQVQELNKKING
jgi:hypothetical protein